jgi:hypothetical protein
MMSNQGTARPRDLATRLFNNLYFQLAWIAFLVAITRFVSYPVRDFILVCWFYGSHAYFHGGIRVVESKGKPTRFSNGDVLPGVPDPVIGVLTFAITVFGLSILLVLILRCYERISKRTSNCAQGDGAADGSQPSR